MSDSTCLFYCCTLAIVHTPALRAGDAVHLVLNGTQLLALDAYVGSTYKMLVTTCLEFFFKVWLEVAARLSFLHGRQVLYPGLGA